MMGEKKPVHEVQRRMENATLSDDFWRSMEWIHSEIQGAIKNFLDEHSKK